MGEKQTKPFQLSFNGLLKVDFQGSHVTSDGGLILVRELDERLGLGELIDEHLSDSRQGTNKQFTEDGRSIDQACPVLWAPAGRGSSQPEAVWRDAAADLGVTCAGRVTDGPEQPA